MVEKYTHAEHFDFVARWLGARGIPIPEAALFPDLGFVVHGTAIGFLRYGNSKLGELDYIVTDPKATPAEKDAALMILFHELEQAAQEKGLLVVTALARIPSLRDKAFRRGYSIHDEGYTLFYRRVQGEEN